MASARTSIIETCTRFEKTDAEQSRSGQTCFKPFDLMIFVSLLSVFGSMLPYLLALPVANKSLQIKSGTRVIDDWYSGQTGIRM
jgi:hypothetical protein